MWTSDDASVPVLPSQEADWTVIDPNQGSAGYCSQATGRPIHFEIEDLKCICLSSISENSGKPSVEILLKKKVF